MMRSMQRHTRISVPIISFALGCALLMSSGNALAGDGQEHTGLTGNLRVDLFGLKDLGPGPQLQQEQAPLAMPSHRSPWLAAGMSALIPGAGQIYTESYWEAALFIAVDAAAWIVAYKYDEKGDKQTDMFQNFANANWSVVKYAEYTQTNLAQPGKVWDVINQMERDIAGYYSHTLPPYNEQQYYELIGKYPQFSQGWRDADPTIGSDYETIKAHLSPMYLGYSVERGKANDYYRSATTWVRVAIVNHLLSAADGAWSALRYNNAQASASMRLVPAGDHYAWMGMATVRIDI